jgi:hypothetical protein
VYSELAVFKGEEVVYKDILIDLDKNQAVGAIDKQANSIIYGALENGTIQKKGHTIYVLVWYTRNGVKSRMDIGIEHY